MIIYLTALEHKNGHLSQVEVNKVLALMGNIGSEASPDHHVPGGGVFLIELFFDIAGDVSLYVVSIQGLVGDVDCVLLHLVRHVGVFDDCFPV